MDESNLCKILDINRYSVNGKFKQNASYIYFERHECPPIANALKFIAVRKNAKDCKDLYAKNFKRSGLYAVAVGGQQSEGYMRPIVCDMTTMGGGWTVIERRFNGQLTFKRNWAKYKAGFGKFDAEFYYGNENWHLLTMDQSTNHELYIILGTKGGDKADPYYDDVEIKSESNNYRLRLGQYQYQNHGPDLHLLNADKFKDYHDGKEFSSFDRDNDQGTDNCSHEKGFGGFWFISICGNVNFHGIWRGEDSVITDEEKFTGIRWKSVFNGEDPIASVIIQIR